ncbi:ribosome-binding factor A, partial [human gut metagenome]
GSLKVRINERVKMRKLPQLIFVPDNSMDYYEHISR